MVKKNDDGVEVLSLFLELGLDPNYRRPFNSPFRDLAPNASAAGRLWHIRHRENYGGETILHSAARLLSDGAVELLLAAGAREDVPAFEYVHQENALEIPILPIDVIGVGVDKKMTPELHRRADTIKNMLARAHLYRKGWLSVLRSRFDAGESLTGSDGGGGGQSGDGGRNDGAEGSLPQRQKGEVRGSSSGDAGVVAVENEAWYGAAVWIASVPGPEVFRIIMEWL